MEISLREADPPDRSGAAPVTDSVEEGVSSLPPEPLLYLARRSGDQATLVPVLTLGPQGPGALPGEMAEPDYRERFRSARMAPGTGFTLFARGARVGSLEVEGPGEAEPDLCAARPAAAGRLELTPSASDVTVFLALARGEGAPGDAFPRGSYRALEDAYEHRVASINLAAALIPEIGAPWPPSVRDTRRDLQVFTVEGAEAPVMATTFVHRDGLAVGPAPASAYSLFFLAADRGEGYQPDYVWYRDYDQEGKGAPRYLGHLDWNRDGSSEVLLEVLGAQSRWFAAVGMENGAMSLLVQEPCGRPEAQAGSGEG